MAADRPQCVGLGIANKTLLDGRLLLAVDAVFQEYTNTAMFGELFNDQWALQFGAQYALNDRVRLRRDTPGTRIRCVIRWAIASAGSSLPAASRRSSTSKPCSPPSRKTGSRRGVSVRDVLPGVDLDLFAGGMFEESQTFGITTAGVSRIGSAPGLPGDLAAVLARKASANSYVSGEPADCSYRLSWTCTLRKIRDLTATPPGTCPAVKHSG